MAKLFDKKDVDMTVGSIPKLILGFFFPMALGLFLQQLYSSVDMIIVGQFTSHQAMAAVGGTGTITNTFVLFCSGISTGAGVIISQYYGNHDKENLRKSIASSVALGLLLSVVMTVLGLVLCKPMLIAMKSNPDVIDLANTYLLIYFGGVSGIILYNMFTSILRAVGDSTRPLIYLAVSSVINIVLDLLFVAVFEWGVIGAGVATIFSQFVSAFLAFLSLVRSKEDYRINLKSIYFDKKITGDILIVGLPAGIQSSITGISNTFVHSYINAFGTNYEAGYSVYLKLDHFIHVIQSSFGFAITTFVGQNVGANNIKRAIKGVNFTILVSLLFSVGLIIPIMIFSDALTNVFTADLTVVDAARYLILRITPFHLFTALHNVYVSALRGCKISRLPMFIVIGSFVVFRQLYLFIISRVLVGELLAVVACFPFGWILSATLLAISWWFCPLCKANAILKKHPEAEDLTPEQIVAWKKAGYPQIEEFKTTLDAVA